MKAEQMIQALEAAASQLGVRVRYDALPPGGVTPGGGLCRVRDEWWVIIDKKTSPSERISVLAEALSDFDTDTLELPGKVREVLHVRKAVRKAAKKAPLAPDGK